MDIVSRSLRKEGVSVLVGERMVTRLVKDDSDDDVDVCFLWAVEEDLLDCIDWQN